MYYKKGVLTSKPDVFAMKIRVLLCRQNNLRKVDIVENRLFWSPSLLHISLNIEPKPKNLGLNLHFPLNPKQFQTIQTTLVIV